MKSYGSVLFLFSVLAFNAQAIPVAVNLGTAGNFGVLGGTEITNSDAGTFITGDVGVSPGSSITGLLPVTNVDGTLYPAANSITGQAQTDLVTAYNVIANPLLTRTDLTGQDLGGLNPNAGVYYFTSSAGLTGVLTLDAHGDPNAQWIFQIGSSLITATDATVLLLNGADACNIFWQVGSSATIQTNNDFAGNILALTDITLNGGTLDGRALARNGAVTINGQLILDSTCASDTGGSGEPPIVPEPASIALLAIGLLGVALFRFSPVRQVA